MVDKKIRILTFHSAYSYGAVLQTYGLYSFLKKHFKDVKVIDFRCPLFSLGFYWNNLKSWIIVPRFSYFKKRIKKTQEVDAEYLRNKGIDADVIIIGSDQVWNKNCTGQYSDIYLGNIKCDSAKIISYAASIGKTELREDEEKEMRFWLPKLDSISLREDSALDICKKFGITDAKHVIDPTFLVDDYAKIIGNQKEKNELALFVLDNSNDECFNTSKYISQELNLKPKVINKFKRIKGFKIIRLPGIIRFLKEIANSRFVITNSYHGLAFSLIFKKQFAYVVTNRKLQSRAYSLLKACGLTDRMFYSYKELENSRIWETEIDYGEVDKRLTPFIQESKNYLICNCK